MKNIFIGLVCVCILSACDSLTSMDPSKPITPEQSCLQLKRQSVYNVTNNNVEASSMARSQREAMQDKYEALDCDNILANSHR